MMHRRRQKLNYDILIPKLDKSIFQLNEREAAAYFAWFIGMVPERVAYVSRVCAAELGVLEARMDCSPESLLLLWKWFRQRAKTEPDTDTDGEKGGKHFSGDQRIKTRKLTLETEYILRDIGMYLGETFRKNNPHIDWTYYTQPRRDFFVNHPLLKGFVDRTFDQPFEASFEPIHMARIQACKMLDKTSSDGDLFALYQLWAGKM